MPDACANVPDVGICQEHHAACSAVSDCAIHDRRCCTRRGPDVAFWLDAEGQRGRRVALIVQPWLVCNVLVWRQHHWPHHPRLFQRACVGQCHAVYDFHCRGALEFAHFGAGPGHPRKLRAGHCGIRQPRRRLVCQHAIHIFECAALRIFAQMGAVSDHSRDGQHEPPNAVADRHRQGALPFVAEQFDLQPQSPRAMAPVLRGSGRCAWYNCRAVVSEGGHRLGW